MVYLARREGCDNTGEITWHVSFASDSWLQFSVVVNGQVYEDGSVSVIVKSIPENCEKSGTINETITIDKCDFPNNASGFSVTAVLKGGKGSNAWQHAQLFRQSLLDSDGGCGLMIKITQK